MNIGIDINSLLSSSRTGVGEYTFELLSGIFVLDKKNQYFLFSNSFRRAVDTTLWNQKNVHFIHTRFPNKIFHFFLQLTKRPYLDELLVKQYEKKNKIKIGHLDVFFSPNIGFASLSAKCRHILTLHDLSFELFPQFFSSKMRLWHAFLRPQKQCEKAVMVLVPSANTQRDVVDIYSLSPEKVHVLPLGRSSSFVQQESTEEEKKYVRQKYAISGKFILFLGTLEPRKNIESLLDAFLLFQKEGGERAREYTLVIAGAKGWKYRHMEKRIRETAGVQYIGYVEAQDKAALYREASVFVYPSLYEGFGLPVLEAMSSGVPVITSNRSSLPEITNGAAYLVDPHNIQEIKTGMERVLFLETVGHSLSEKGRVQAQVFEWARTAEEFLKLAIK